jgi:hypothetical protein
MNMTKKGAEEKPENPELVFEIAGDNGVKIPVEVYFAVPFEVAHKIEIRQYVEGEKYPALDFLFIDRSQYTHEYVVTGIECIPLIVAKDKEHFLLLMREKVLPGYDGDLVTKIEVIVR